MISRTRMSPISKIPWIISRSRSSRTPSSSPTSTSIFSSSSVTKGPRTGTLPPIGRTTRLVTPVRMLTMGRITVVATPTNGARLRATRSARCRASVLGAISQTMRTISERSRLTIHSATRSWYRCSASTVAAEEATMIATVLMIRMVDR